MPQQKKIDTLKKRAEFLATAACGKKWVALGFILQISDNKGTCSRQCRYGLTASKRVGGAVVRNRARRRLRSLAREILTDNAAKEYDYVLIARAATVNKDYAEMRNDLINALKRLKLWRGE